MKKQTAVEWLTEQIAYKNYYGHWKMWHKYGDLDDIINEAKAMEREQIEEAYQCGQSTPYEYSEDNEVNWYDSTTYYNKTYGGEQ